MPSSARETIIDRDGHVYLIRDFWSEAQSNSYFDEFASSCPWRQDELTVFGRKYLTPRLTSWHGDVPYTYSGLTMAPEPWSHSMIEIKGRIEKEAEARFNSVLFNMYRDGNDSMGWHQDDEDVLGTNPLIASVNFGQTRRFRLRHKTKTQEAVTIDLPNCSLLIMAGSTQHHWQHAVPKTKKTVGPRINLTFRWTASPEKVKPNKLP
jgi:alkylated DNA repair dioxygenase AlkB